MVKTQIELKKTDSILDEITRIHDDISRRAYALSQSNEFWSDALESWLRAERELVWRPAVELRQTDGRFELVAALPGVNARDLDVQVTPEDVLIKADRRQQHDSTEGTVHVREFSSGKLFRSIHLPDRIDPESVTAEYRDGLLRLTATVAKAAAQTAPKTVAVQAA